MAGRVEEGDLVAGLQRDLIGPDVLGDAPVLAGGHAGGAQGVQQRGLAVVHVTHDGHHRRPGQGVLHPVVLRDEPGFHVAFRHAGDRMTEFRGDQLRRVGIQHVIDGQHGPLAHHVLDDVHGPYGHPLGKVLHGDGVGDDYVADHLGRIEATEAPGALFPFPFPGAADRGEGTHAVVAAHFAGGDRDGQS